MIVSFADKGTDDIYNKVDNKAARRACPHQIWKSARRKLDQLGCAVKLSDLKAPLQNKLEALKRDREGQHAIRSNVGQMASIGTRNSGSR